MTIWDETEEVEKIAKEVIDMLRTKSLSIRQARMVLRRAEELLEDETLREERGVSNGKPENDNQ